MAARRPVRRPAAARISGAGADRSDAGGAFSEPPDCGEEAWGLQRRDAPEAAGDEGNVAGLDRLQITERPECQPVRDDLIPVDRGQLDGHFRQGAEELMGAGKVERCHPSSRG